MVDASRRGPEGAGATRGRPRDPGRDVIILGAALSLLGELGYDQLSIESVAARAGVGKSTIYRRFSGKAALVAAAVDQQTARTPPDVGDADPRHRLIETLRWLARQMEDQEPGLLDATFAGMRHDPELAAEMRRIRHRDEIAMTRGLEPEAAELFSELAPALILHRLVLGEPCDERFLAHVADDILLPLTAHRGGQTPRSPSEPAPDQNRRTT